MSTCSFSLREIVRGFKRTSRDVLDAYEWVCRLDVVFVIRALERMVSDFEWLRTQLRPLVGCVSLQPINPSIRSAYFILPQSIVHHRLGTQSSRAPKRP